MFKFLKMNIFKSYSIVNIAKVIVALTLVGFGVKYHSCLNPSAISSFVGRYGLIAPFIFIVLCSFRPVLFFFPKMGLTIVAGVLFGAFWGTIYVVIGGIFSTAVGFYFARWFGRGIIKDIVCLERKMGQIDDWAQEYGKNAVLVMRLFNIPWDMVSYWAGLSNIRFKDFYIASMIPLIPISFLYTYFGSRVFSPWSAGFIIPLLIIFIMSAMPFVRQRLRKCI